MFTFTDFIVESANTDHETVEEAISPEHQSNLDKALAQIAKVHSKNKDPLKDRGKDKGVAQKKADAYDAETKKRNARIMGARKK